MAVAIMLHTPTPDDELAIEVDVFDRQPTPPDRLPDPEAAVRAIAQGIVDVLNGQRPLGQLNAVLAPEVREQLGVAAATAARARQPQLRRAPLPRAKTLRFMSPAAGVVEASVVVAGKPRCKALALRLEGLDGRWQCTALGVT